MAKITYTDKVALNVNADVPDINKVKADDMNEIKTTVNTNYDEVGNITSLTTTDKSSVVNAINEIEGKYTNDTLWTGSETISGEKTITLNAGKNVYNYRFIVFDGNYGTLILVPVIQSDDHLCGSMGLMSGGGNYVTNAITAYVADSGAKIRISQFKALTHTTSSNHSSLSNNTLIGVYGIK